MMHIIHTAENFDKKEMMEKGGGTNAGVLKPAHS
jgi:hypothetical protein